MTACICTPSRVYPPKSPKQASTADSFENTPVALLAVHPVSYWPHIGPPKGIPPTRISGWGTCKLYAQKCARQTKCEARRPDSNLDLGQAMQGWVGSRGGCAGMRAECKAEYDAGRWVIFRLAYLIGVQCSLLNFVLGLGSRDNTPTVDGSSECVGRASRRAYFCRYA